MLREGSADRRHRRSSAPSPAVHRRADRPAQDLRRPGGDRDRERPAVQGAGGPEQRADRDPRAADGDERDPARHLQLADGRPAGVRRRLPRTPRGSARRGRQASIRATATCSGSSRLTDRFHWAERELSVEAGRSRRRPRRPRPECRPRRGYRRPTGETSSRGLTPHEGLGYRTILAMPLIRDGDADRRHHDPAGEAGRSPQAGRAAQDLRRPGGDRHRERAAVHRAAGADARAHALGGRAAGPRRGQPGRQLHARSRGRARHHREPCGAAVGQRPGPGLRVRRGHADVPPAGRAPACAGLRGLLAGGSHPPRRGGHGARRDDAPAGAGGGPGGGLVGGRAPGPRVPGP